MLSWNSIFALTLDCVVVAWWWAHSVTGVPVAIVATVCLGVGAILATRTRETLFVEVPQLILQAYVGGLILIVSTVGTVSVACCLANRWLAQETKGGYWLGVCFFASMIVARLTAFTTAFRVFGWWACVAVAYVLGLRALPFFQSPSDAPIALALALAPLGAREAYKFWSPEDYDSASISEILDSPVGVVNFGFHILENLLLFLAMLLAGMTPKFLLLFGLLPTALGTLCYAGTRSLNIKRLPRLPQSTRRTSKPTMEETETVVL